jgi:photosystem II stability/assembly factor-like uncharacterized protein
MAPSSTRPTGAQHGRLKPRGPSKYLGGVSAVDASNCWAVGSSGTIVHTTDGGSTWTSQSSGTPSTWELSGVSSADASNCWVVGYGGTILFNGTGSPPPPPSARTWAHDSVGVTEPSDTWYLAEGATAGGFETWVLVQNPNDDPANVTLTYMTGNGEVPGGTISLPPNSRQSVNVGFTVQTFKVSTKVISNRPVIAERAMYGDAL